MNDPNDDDDPARDRPMPSESHQDAPPRRDDALLVQVLLTELLRRRRQRQEEATSPVLLPDSLLSSSVQGVAGRQQPPALASNLPSRGIHPVGRAHQSSRKRSTINHQEDASQGPGNSAPRHHRQPLSSQEQLLLQSLLARSILSSSSTTASHQSEFSHAGRQEEQQQQPDMIPTALFSMIINRRQQEQQTILDALLSRRAQDSLAASSPSRPFSQPSHESALVDALLASRQGTPNSHHLASSTATTISSLLELLKERPNSMSSLLESVLRQAETQRPSPSMSNTSTTLSSRIDAGQEQEPNSSLQQLLQAARASLASNNPLHSSVPNEQNPIASLWQSLLQSQSVSSSPTSTNVLGLGSTNWGSNIQQLMQSLLQTQGNASVASRHDMANPLPSSIANLDTESNHSSSLLSHPKVSLHSQAKDHDPETLRSNGPVESDDEESLHQKPKARPRTNNRQGEVVGIQQQRWAQRLQELKDFQRIHGHVCVPIENYEPNPSLSHWVKRQRHQKKIKDEGRPSTMTDEREALLNELGFVWDSHSAAWQQRWMELQSFRHQHGHCNVPCSYAARPQLAIWVKCQRRQYQLWKQGKTSHMTPQRCAQLESIGFCWSPAAKGKQK